MKQSAFTLAELIVASFIGLLALGVLVQAFIMFNRQSETPLASMSMEQSTLYVMRMLQRDIGETNLQSIRSLPNAGGFVLESPRDNRDFLKFSDFGAVQWQKFVSYRVQPAKSQSNAPRGITLSELVYDETTAGVRTCPSFAPDVPFGTPSPGRQRAVAHNVAAGGGKGCDVYFPDPTSGQPTPFDGTRRGEPVCVHLSLLDISSRTGKATTRELFMMVKPRN